MTFAVIATGALACTANTNAEAPDAVDESHLVFEETPAALWSDSDGTQILQMDVRNESDAPTAAATGTFTLLGKHFTGELLPLAPAGVAPRPLGPNERGLLQVHLGITPFSGVRSSPSSWRTIDPRSVAPGTRAASRDDQRRLVSAGTRRWMRADPRPSRSDADQAAVKAASNKTLDDVVSSRVSGRSDGSCAPTATTPPRPRSTTRRSRKASRSSPSRLRPRSRPTRTAAARPRRWPPPASRRGPARPAAGPFASTTRRPTR